MRNKEGEDTMFGEKKEKRFVRTVHEIADKGSVGGIFVYADIETGVQYIHIVGDGRGGLTVLVDREGKPLLREDLIKKPSEP